LTPMVFLTFNAHGYTLHEMIRSFNCEETQRIFRRQFFQRLPRKIQSIALRKLRMVNRSLTLNDLLVPHGNRLEKLHREREGKHSIRVNAPNRAIDFARARATKRYTYGLSSFAGRTCFERSNSQGRHRFPQNQSSFFQTIARGEIPGCNVEGTRSPRPLG